MPLSEGAIYTIREIVPDSISCQYEVPESGLPLVKLVEVQDRGPSDIGYQWTRFRALPPDETLSEKQIEEVV